MSDPITSSELDELRRRIQLLEQRSTAAESALDAARSNASRHALPRWFEFARLGLEICTLLILIITIRYAALHAQEFEHLAKVGSTSTLFSTWAMIANQGMEIDKAFVENARFQKYFFLGAKLPEDASQEERERATMLAMMQLDYLDNAAGFLKYVKREQPEFMDYLDPDAWNKYFEWSFAKSPLLCQTLLDRDVAGTFGSVLSTMGKEACRKPQGRPN